MKKNPKCARDTNNLKKKNPKRAQDTNITI